MNPITSIYLDLVRFLAAVVVFLAHISSQDLTDGFLWQFNDYAQTAVIIFFVLSGYVITFVSDVKEKDVRSFALARVSRIYSVVIPALLLTGICDFIGLTVNSEFYHDSSWPYPEGNQVVNYFLSFLLIQNVWSIGLNPGINQPFWSLTFEWIYYFAFMFFFYFRGLKKWLLPTVCLIIGGPNIIVLLPCWIIGAITYKVTKRKSEDDGTTSVFKAIASISAIILIIFITPELRKIDTSFFLMTRKYLLGDYFDALLFCVHLYYSPSFIHYFRGILTKYVAIIRWLGSLTFALYLFHRPIIQLIAAVYEGSQSSSLYRLSMIVITFVFVATIGLWCERQKFAIKNFLKRKVVFLSNE